MHYLLNFDVRIPKLFTSRDENGNVHTEYVITVCTNLSVWNVCRKIHNFTELHDTLSKQFPQVQLPKLPLKNSNQRRHTLDSTKARSVSVTEIKRAELEVYLLSLISIHDIWISAAFVEFFDDSPAPSLGMQIQFTAVSNQVLCLKQGQSDIENRLATTENMLSSALQLIQELELRLGKEEVHCAHAAPLSGPAQLLPITQPSYMKPSSDPYVWSSLKRASMLGGVHENDITSTAYSKVDRNDRNVEESGSHVLGRALSSTDSPGNGMITTSMGSVNGYMSPPLLIDDSSVTGSRISADLRFYQRRPSGSAVSSNNNTSGLLRKNDEVHCDTEEEKIANRSSLKYHRTPSVTSGPTQLVSVEEEIGCQDRAQIEVEESKKDSEATLSSPFGTTARYIAPVDMSDVLDAVLRLNCKSNSNDNNHVNSGTNTHATNMKSSVFSLFKVVEDDVDVVPTTMELSDAPPLPTYFDDDRFPLASPTPYSFEEYSLGLDQMLELLHVASLYSVGEPSLCYQNGLDTSNNMISARINLIAFMEKHIRKVVSSKVFAVGLSTSLHCLLPDDSIELTALLWKGSESSWVGVVYEYFSRLFGQLYTHGSYIDSIVSSIQLTAATEQKLDKMQKNLLLPLPIAHPSVQMDQALEANISNSFSSVSTPIVSINGSKEEEEKQHDWEEFCEDIRHASLVYSKYACRLVEVDGNSLLRFQFDDIVVNFAPNSRKDMCMTAFIQQFSEKVGKNELFKRSMLLIRAWWKYEVPTYFGGMNTTLHEYLSNDALVVMLCAIFNMYNDRLKDPLQVMTAFFFEYGGGLKDEVSSSYNDNERHRFDWNTSVVTLQGPVPIEDFNFSAPPVGCVKPWHVADDALLMKYSNMYNDKGLVYVSTWSSSNSNTAVVPPEDATFPVTSSLSNVDICENEENLVTASPTHSARHSANNVNTIAPACYYGPHEPCPRREINIIHPLHPSINMIPSADTLSQLNPAGGLHTALKFVFDTAFEKFRNTIEIPSNPPNATDANANVGLKLPVDFFPNTIGRFGSPYVHLFTNKGLMCEDGDVSGGVSGTYSSLHTPSPFSFINSKNQSSSNSNTTSRRNSLKPQMNPVAKQPNSLSLANALEAAGDAPDVSELPEDASFIVRFKSYGQRLKKLTALRSVNTPRMLLCTDCAYKTLIDWFGVAVSAIEAWDQVQYANLMLKGYVTDSSLWSLCCDVLIDRGFMPVGEIGKLLQELTMSVSFSTILKDKYGGLKKFLEMFPEDFYLR